jgi:hypothetical protein
MDYIICNFRKSKPKVSIKLCGKCKRIRTCTDYGRYIQPSLFPEIVLGTNRKKPKPLIIKHEPAEVIERSKQLTFEY